MAVSIVRIDGASLPTGTVNTALVNFWLYIEVAVTVMIVSITSYRSLFVKDKSTNGKSPGYDSRSCRKRLWSRGRRDEEEKGVEMPTLPDPTLTGARTVIGRTGKYDELHSRSDDMFLAVDNEGDHGHEGGGCQDGASYRR
ncbi:MAG: hypothetical protein Q9166_003817 [cf. Caloplaca sp. 2 TL-2023]